MRYASTTHDWRDCRHCVGTSSESYLWAMTDCGVAVIGVGSTPQGNFLPIDRLRAPAKAFSNTAAVDCGIDKNKIGRDFSSGAFRIARGWAKSLGSVRAEQWSYPIMVACREWRSPRHCW
jgi:hypothetical protein